MTTYLGKRWSFGFTVRVFRGRLSIFMCVLLSLLVLGVASGFIVLIPDYYLSVNLVYVFLATRVSSAFE